MWPRPKNKKLSRQCTRFSRDLIRPASLSTLLILNQSPFRSLVYHKEQRWRKALLSGLLPLALSTSWTRRASSSPRLLWSSEWDLWVEQFLSISWAVRLSSLAGAKTRAREAEARLVKSRIKFLLPKFKKYCTFSQPFEVKCVGRARQKSQSLSLTLGNLPFRSICLKLFWTSPEFSQGSNESWKVSATLARRASDQWNLIARLENPLDYRTQLWSSPV